MSTNYFSFEFEFCKWSPAYSTTSWPRTR